MREKGKLQAVLDFSSPSSSTSSAAATDENTASKSESPVHLVKTVLKKKVNFLSPPKWKLKHTVGGGSKSTVSGKSQRTALKPLQSNKLNSKLLVGRGSPRIPTFGKTSKLKQSVITCTSPLSTKESRKQPISCTAEQGTQTDSDVTSSLDYRMCTQEEPPSEYWQILAERRRVALAEALKENEELYTDREDWKKRENQLESRVKDLEYFAMMYNLASKEDS